MVAFADEGVAFWDENSPGTRDSIKKLRNAGKLVRVITGWKT
jgi:magnesium-transporting ATPase (P-type)